MKRCMRWLALFGALVSAAVSAGEKSLYDFSWLDKDKEIYVLQNRKFRKEGRVYAGASGVKTLSGAFVDSLAGTARLGYFFKEDWGVEVFYSKYSGSENDTAKGVREQGTVPFYRKFDTATGALLWWSPFYAKINTFNQIFYFDWMFGVGATSVSTKDNRNKFLPGKPDTLTSETNTAATWSTAMRFYISDHWSLRMDFTGMHYNAERKTSNTSGKKQMFSNYDFGLGLMYAF